MEIRNRNLLVCRKKIKAIVLDMDGVLVDTEPIHMKSFAIFLDELNIKYTDTLLQSFIGYSITDNILDINKKFLKGREINITEGVRKRDSIYITLLKETKLVPIPGIRELVEFCIKKNITLNLASSSDKDQVDIILDNLDGLEIRHKLRSIVHGNSVKNKKPSPDIYLKTIHILNMPAETCLAIEDSDAGVISAKSAGLFCLAFKNPHTKVHHHPDADGVVDRISEVMDLLDL